MKKKSFSFEILPIQPTNLKSEKTTKNSKIQTPPSFFNILFSQIKKFSHSYKIENKLLKEKNAFLTEQLHFKDEKIANLMKIFSEILKNEINDPNFNGRNDSLCEEGYSEKNLEAQM